MVDRLAVVHSGAALFVLSEVMGVDIDTAARIGGQLIQVGLAEEHEYNYLRLDPALSTYLALGQSPEHLAELRATWARTMTQLVDFLYWHKFNNSLMSTRLTLLDLPNLLALLNWLEVRVQTDPATAEAVSQTVRHIEQLLEYLDRPQALAQAVAVREKAAATLSTWSHARFEHEALQVERLLQQGQLQAAHEHAQTLLETAKHVGPTAYPRADYDLAMAVNLLGQVFFATGQVSRALGLFVESQQLCEALGKRGELLTSAVLTRQADCLKDLEKLNEATELYQETIHRYEQLENFRDMAASKANLADVLRRQGRYTDALAAYTEARAFFEMHNEPAMVAGMWHQIGIVHQDSGNYEAAEAAYRKALEIGVQNNLQGNQAASLVILGILYAEKLNRLEDAVTFYRQAADIYMALGDLWREGNAHNSIALTLYLLGHHGEARAEIAQAIECNRTVEPWISFVILHDIETAEGNGAAARAACDQARDAYLAYRRQGGHAQQGYVNLIEQVVSLLAQQKFEEMQALLYQGLNHPQTPERLKHLIQALVAVLNGARDPALADDPALDYANAAEVLWLMERLGQRM